MPWKVRKRGDEYCVVKFDGEVEKCHPTRPKANAHMRALYASEGKEMDETKDVEKDTEDQVDKSSYYDEDGNWRWVPDSITSFSELDEAEAANEKAGVISTLVSKFKAIIDNIFYNSDVSNKSAAIEKATSEFNQRLQSVKEAGKDDEAVHSSFNLFKSADGTWHWVAVWSNKYKDNDNPPDILAEASHLDFVKAVEVDKTWEHPRTPTLALSTLCLGKVHSHCL